MGALAVPQPDRLLKLAGRGCAELGKGYRTKLMGVLGRAVANTSSREESLKRLAKVGLWEEHGRTRYLVWGIWGQARAGKK